MYIDRYVTHRERGQWADYYPSLQSLYNNVISFVGLTTLGTFTAF